MFSIVSKCCLSLKAVPLCLAHLSFIRQLVMVSMESGSTSANSPTDSATATKEVLACFGEQTGAQILFWVSSSRN